MRIMKLGLTGLAIMAFLTGGPMTAHAASPHDTHHGYHGESNMTMKEVMQGLNAELKNLTDAIILEDYTAIEQSARGIAHHPPPSEAELKRIFSILGEDSEAFKACDQAVHDLAAKLARIAEKKNMKDILDTYHAMIVKTVECHASFKDNISGKKLD